MEESRTTTRVSSLFTTSCSPTRSCSCSSCLLQLPIRRGWAEEELKKESGKGEMSSRKKKERTQKELNFCRGGASPGAVAQILENPTKRNGFACETSKVFDAAPSEQEKLQILKARHHWFS